MSKKTLSACLWFASTNEILNALLFQFVEHFDSLARLYISFVSSVLGINKDRSQEKRNWKLVKLNVEIVKSVEDHFEANEVEDAVSK